MACRKAFAALVAEWRAMGEDARKEWNERARGKNLSGFNAFISANMERMREAISAPAAPVMVTVVTSSRSKDMGHADTSVRTLVIVGRGMLSRTSSRAPCGAVARRERS
jgi:hypothetical protein